jgi:hypothetical protein
MGMVRGIAVRLSSKVMDKPFYCFFISVHASSRVKRSGDKNF